MTTMAESRSYPSPPSSVSPTKSSFQDSKSSPLSRRYSSQKASIESSNTVTPRRRCSSLSERFPGDMSHRPLELLRRETKAANHAPHLKKKNIPGADTIDSLDNSAFGLLYHHGGPYDSTLLARNRNLKYAPIEALKSSNEEALKATPNHYIRDAVEKHIPLQGTATIPSGMRAFDGQILIYEDGADLMRESDAPGGAYRRWTDMRYHPDDLKGKGEPSYTYEKMLKKEKSERRKTRSVFCGEDEYELMPVKTMPSSKRNASGSNYRKIEAKPQYSLLDSDRHIFRRRSAPNSLWTSDGLRRRIGSLTRGKKANLRDETSK